MTLKRMIGFYDGARLFKIQAQAADGANFEVETTAPDKSIKYFLTDNGALMFLAVETRWITSLDPSARGNADVA